ncbi:hypothetical protein NL676_000883 [Syzygium grande]|nr:hypothetical protein NL676_000883 [Syzygium grande]
METSNAKVEERQSATACLSDSCGFFTKKYLNLEMPKSTSLLSPLPNWQCLELLLEGLEMKDMDMLCGIRFFPKQLEGF